MRTAVLLSVSCLAATALMRSAAPKQEPMVKVKSDEIGGSVTGWGDRPQPVSSPVAASRSSTLVDWVEQSTPRTSVTGQPAVGTAHRGTKGRPRPAR